jgi:uncharacterized membrane protein YeiB
MTRTETTASSATTVPAPMRATEVSARSLAPDLARGAMLLLIALGNAHLFLYQHRPMGLRAYPVADSFADRVAITVPMTFFDGRELPLFAFLFGYGAVQLSRRAAEAGADYRTVRALLRRRGWCMVLIGFVHALLLFSGDIIAAYGLAGVALAATVLRATDRRLLIAVGFGAVAVLAVTAAGVLSDGANSYLPSLKSMSETDPLAAVGPRVGEWVGLTALTALFETAPAMLLGVWAARRRLLDEPERHRPLLMRAAVVGLGVAYAGGLPCAWMAAHWTAGQSASTSTAVAGTVHELTGYAGGLGYAAVAGLVAIRLADRRSRFAGALVAAGQRSMTCYLLQSVVWVALLASYGGRLGSHLGLMSTAVLATATWALSVVLAERMNRRGHRGPAELLLRRLAYRRGDLVRAP